MQVQRVKMGNYTLNGRRRLASWDLVSAALFLLQVEPADRPQKQRFGKDAQLQVSLPLGQLCQLCQTY